MNLLSVFKEQTIGLGTWHMGESRAAAQAETNAVLHALERGVRVIDTAEMYADGGAERIVGQALKAFGAQRRDGLCIVTKVLPMHATRDGTIAACEASLQRLGIDYVDLLLLHWEGNVPYERTLEGFAALRERGLIRDWGVSNFDLAELDAWCSAERRLGLQHCAANQVYYSLLARGPEFDLLPAMAGQQMPLMAYTPLGSGKLAQDSGLAAIAQPLGLTAAQLALAWTVRSGGVVAIPKSSTPARIDENLAAAVVRLDADTLARIDALYPPPKRKRPLAML
jgi:diketogulonate reductase-like aldo/keto reductase